MSGLFDDVLKPKTPAPATAPSGPVRLFDDVLKRDPSLPPLPPIDVPIEMSGNGDIPKRPQDREVGRIYTDKRGVPRRWMGDSWASGDAARETTAVEKFEGGYNDLIQGFTRAPEAILDLGYWANKLNPADRIARALVPGYANRVDSGMVDTTRFFENARRAYEQFKPEAYRAEQAKPVVQRDAEGNITGVGLPSTEQVGGALMQTAPQIPQMIAGGGGARTLVGEVLPNMPKLAAFLGYGTANAGMVAPNAAEQARVEALDAGATPEQADRAANVTMALTAPLTLATGGAGEGMSAVQGQGSRNLLSALLRGFATEAPTEGVEEAGQSAIGDIAQGRDINIANALEQGIQAAFAGGVPGSAIAGTEYLAGHGGTGPAMAPAAPPSITPPAAARPTAAPAETRVVDPELDALLLQNALLGAAPAPAPAAASARPPINVDQIAATMRQQAQQSAATATARNPPAAMPAPVAESIPASLPDQAAQSDEPSGPTIEKDYSAPRRRIVRRSASGRPMDLLEVIAANGGLNLEAWRAQGVDPAEFTRRAGFGYVFRKKGGMTPDQLREFMQQEHYLQRDPEDATPTVDQNDAIELFDRAFRGGERIYAADQADQVAAFRQSRQQADDEYRAELAGMPEFSPPEGAAAEGFDPFAEDPIAAEFAQRIADLTEEAVALGASDSEIVGAAFDAPSAGAHIANLEDIIHARSQADRGAAPRNRTGVAEPGQEAQPDQGAGDFQLDAPEAEPAGERKPITSQPGLFAPPTTREQIAARERASDAERNGLRRDMVPASRGDGELFAGRRPEQADIEQDDLARARVDDAASVIEEPADPMAVVDRQVGDVTVKELAGARAAVSRAERSGSAGDLIRDLASQPLPPDQKFLADKLAPIMDRLGVKVVTPPADADHGGAYRSEDNTIYIQQALPSVILHEAIHGATSALLESRAARENSETVRRARIEMEELLTHVQQYVRENDIQNDARFRRLVNDPQGALSNTKELLTYGMTDSRFQELLRKIPAPSNREQNRTAWDKFKSLIWDFLNIPPRMRKRTTLDALLETSGELIDFAESNPDAVTAAREDNIARRRAVIRPVDRAGLNLTPEQETAMAKAGMPTDSRTTLARVADRLRQSWNGVREAVGTPDTRRQALADRFHGLRAAEAQVGGLAPEESPYLAARLTTGLPSIMESMMNFGAPKWDGGALAIDEKTTGLLDALKPVSDDIDAWLGWMVGRRAKLLKDQGREHLFTDADINALLSLSNGREQQFADAAKAYLRIKNNVLDVAEQAGLIDPAQRAAWDHAEYIPFYRQEGERALGPGTRKGLEGQSSGIRTLRGGESELSDPLANIVRNFTRLIDASLKNRAMLLAVDKLGKGMFEKKGPDFEPVLIPMDQVKRTLREQGVPESTIQSMPAGALKGVQRMFSLKPPDADNVVRVMRDGKAEYYEVADPVVLRALTSFKQQTKHPAVQPFIFAKRLLTTGVTATADFVAANFLRDTASTWIIGDKRIKLGIDAAQGVVRTLFKDKATRDMMAGGGSFIGGNLYGGDVDATAAALRRALRAKGMNNRDIEGFIGTVARSPMILWDKWMELSSAIENSNRNAVYRAAIASGKPRIQAIYEAKDLMDFSMQGDSAFMQFFSDVLPFFNARVQGLYKLGRAAADPATKRQIMTRGALLALASVALWAWNTSQYGDGYDELEEWDKDTYWHIAPGTRWHVRIPKPFEVGLLFGTAPERMAQAMAGNDRAEQSWDSLFRAITGTLAINPIPQGVLPIVEQWANRRFFTGRPIESMGDEKLLPEAREEWYTSDTMKLLSDIAGNQTGASAKRLEHLWNGYTGGLGMYALDSSDWLVREATDAPSRPTPTVSDYPVVGRFLRGDAEPKNTRYVTEFYDLREKAQQVSGTIKTYLDQGDAKRAERLEREWSWLLGEKLDSKRAKGGVMFQNVKDMEAMVRALGKERDETEDLIRSPASAGEKRQAVDANLSSRNDQMKAMVRRLREAQRLQSGGR